VDGLPVEHGEQHRQLGGRPACLNLFDAHSVLVSRPALRLAGIDGPRQFGSRSAIVCDDHGRPTGHLLEWGAISLVRAVIPPEPFASRRDRLAALLQDMAAAGLTGGHVMDPDGDALELYAALEEDGRLPLRLRLAPWLEPDAGPETVRQVLALHGRSGRLWEVAAVKLFIDGTVDGGTAWLHEPDCMASPPGRTGRTPTTTPRRSASWPRPGCRPPPTPSATPPSGTSWTP